MITGRTALYGVLGHPVAHSLSPAMQNAAFAALGIDACYLPLPVSPERLLEGIRGAHALGFAGLNVTVPHKQRAAQACLALDPVAVVVAAVNTLRRTSDGYEGFNTDAPAALALLEAAGVRQGWRALLLGAGGAARAGAWALLKAGAAVRVAARRSEAAAELCRVVGAAFPGGRIGPVAISEAVLEADRCHVVVNATTIGLPGHEQEGAMPAFRLRQDQVAVDFVYGDTAFARAAARAGAQVVNGEQILVRQGALAFALWTGQAAPESAMAAALRQAPGGARR
ncbi:MAG TPA: shikimate dehydrogenase [Anaeromyxobacteraceae bacterium]|nr:shikimate dehydrogenase [Anaeromyxobacteraceae bacterium]